MSDDPVEHAPTDRSRINVNDAREVRWWARHLGVSEQEILDAVKVSGPKVSDVRRHLDL